MIICAKMLLNTVTILDIMGSIMGSLKSACTTSCRSSVETIALNCIVFFFRKSRFYLAIQRSVAFGVILSLLFFCTVEDISTQDGAIGVKFWLR